MKSPDICFLTKLSDSQNSSPTQLAVASADPCSDCTAMVTTIATYLTSEDSIARQVEVLLAEVCPGSDDPDMCVAGLPAFWAKIAMMLWPGYYNPEEPWMCATEDICGAPGAKYGRVFIFQDFHFFLCLSGLP